MIKNNKRIEYKIILILMILLVPSVTALTMNTPSIITAEQEELVSFEIKFSNNVSPINIDASIGLINIENEKYKFVWTATYNEKEYEEINFTITDNTTIVKSTTIIAKPPKITGLTDASINENKYKFSLTTNIASTCKYSLSNKTYENMEYTMNNNDKISHEGITPILNQGIHKIYVICKSEIGGENKTSFPINVNTLPSATIILKPSSPLKSGIIEVEVIASENLISAPELKYFFDDDTNPKTVTLTGTDNRWKGHLVIQETDKRRIGTFTFKGIDTTNLEGTEITSGKTFIVDNYRPSIVSSIMGTIQSDRINLEWIYLNEKSDDIKEYRIYRRERSGGVDYVDYYATTTNNYYYDRDILYEHAYYYKVSAVNNAGKEGELSKEIALTFIPQETEITTEENELSAVLKSDLKIKISEIDKIIFDLELIESKIQRKTNEETIIIQDLNLLASIVSTKNKINNIKIELEKLENKPLTKTEFDLATTKLLEESKEAFSKIPQDIIIKDVINYQEMNDEESIRKIINTYLKNENFNLTEKETQKFIETLIEKQYDYFTNVRIIKATINYENYSENITHLTKTLVMQEELEQEEQEIFIIEDVNLQENENIIFLNNPTILKDDLIKWNVNDINKNEIKYYLKKDIQIDNIKNTKTIIFEEQQLQEKKNLITSKVTQEKGERITPPLLAPIILGILSVLFLSIYYFKSDDKTMMDLISLKNIMPLVKKKETKDLHKKLDLQEPPSYEIETKLEEKNESKELEKKTNDEETKEYSPEIEELNEKEEMVTAIHELKNMMEDIYYGDEEDFDYLAKLKQLKKKFSKNAPQGKEFILKDGRQIKNLKELKQSLKTMNDDVFYHHVNQEKNDFYNWIKDVYKYKGLAYKIKNIKTKKEIIKKLNP